MCTSYHGMTDDAREGSVLPLFQIFIGTIQKVLQVSGFRLVFAYIPELHLHILRFFFPAGIFLLLLFFRFCRFFCLFSVRRISVCVCWIFCFIPALLLTWRIFILGFVSFGISISAVSFTASELSAPESSFSVSAFLQSSEAPAS